MLYDPRIQYELFKSRQRDRWQEAERDRHARAATQKQAGRVQWVETTPDLSDMVERVIQTVWKRLGLPAREAVSQPLPTPSGERPLLPA